MEDYCGLIKVSEWGVKVSILARAAHGTAASSGPRLYLGPIMSAAQPAHTRHGPLLVLQTINRRNCTIMEKPLLGPSPGWKSLLVLSHLRFWNRWIVCSTTPCHCIVQSSDQSVTSKLQLLAPASPPSPAQPSPCCMIYSNGSKSISECQRDHASCGHQHQHQLNFHQ